MKEITTEIEIDASPERVWAVLTDFSAYPEWNPFVRTVEGQTVVGTRLKAYVKASKGLGMTIKPTVLVADPNRELRWLGRTLLPGVFDGEHYFTIEALGSDRVRFTQGERFRGALVWLMGAIGVIKNARGGFVDLNQALKDRAEHPA